MRTVWLLTCALILETGTTVLGAAPESNTAAPALSNRELSDFQSRLLSATTKHLDLLVGADGKVLPLKSKAADSMTASAFHIIYEMTGNKKYRAAALELADRIVKNMKATKFGVLYIKEKEKPGGEVIPGGGPPAFGWYTATAAQILHNEGGRNEDLKYIATVVDNYPWNDEGWWSADINVNTGESKQPLTKPSPINKNAAMAMAAAMLSGYVKDLDPVLSARLKGKADKCIYGKILPAQQADGFWHYGLTGNDPNNKDILGYFMVTMHALMQVQQFTGEYRDPAFQSALDKGHAFALRHIAPMTEPNHGPPAPRTTPSTPDHYSVADDLKRGFALGMVLFGSKNYGEGVRIMDCWMKNFPYGDAGADGAHAVHPSAIILLLLQKEAPLKTPSL